MPRLKARTKRTTHELPTPVNLTRSQHGASITGPCHEHTDCWDGQWRNLDVGVGQTVGRHHSAVRRRRKELVITAIELALMAALGIIGCGRRPVRGRRAPAAAGP